MGPEWIDVLDRHCGVPPEAMTSIGRHVELDKHHVEEGCNDIDALVTDAGRFPSLREMLSTTMDSFTAFCNELCETAA